MAVATTTVVTAASVGYIAANAQNWDETGVYQDGSETDPDTMRKRCRDIEKDYHDAERMAEELKRTTKALNEEQNAKPRSKAQNVNCPIQQARCNQLAQRVKQLNKEASGRRAWDRNACGKWLNKPPKPDDGHPQQADDKQKAADDLKRSFGRICPGFEGLL